MKRCNDRHSILRQGRCKGHIRRTTENKAVEFCALLFFLLCVLFSHPPVCAQDTQTDAPQTGTSSEQAPSPEKTEDALELSPELSLFEEIPIVVSASKKPERVTSAPSIISVVSAEDIERMGAKTLMDVLRTIPGMEIVRDELGVSQIAVRGLHEEHSPGVKILIDGHSLNDPMTGGATTMYDDLALTNVSRIEIIRGPASALYGANAFVSVVQVITKKTEEIDGISMAFGAGSFDSYNPSLLIGKIFNELDVMFSADYFTTNGAEFKYEEDGLSPYDNLVQNVGLGPFSLAPGMMQEEREKIDLSWNIGYKNFSFDGKYLQKHRGPFLTNFYTLNHDSFEDTRHAYADLKYHRYFNDRIEFGARLYADSFSLDNNQQVGRGILLPTSDGEWMELPDGLIVAYGGESQRYGIEGQVDVHLFRNNDLILGAEYEYSGTENVFFRTNTFSETLETGSMEPVEIQDILDGVNLSSFQHFAAFFAQDRWRIRPSIDLTLGLRGDYYSEFGGVLTPKAGLSYEPSPSWNLKALFGSAFRVPSFMETFFVGTNAAVDLEEGENVFQGTDELVVEDLYTFELGVGYQGSEWFRGNLNYFYSDLNKLVEVPEEEEAKWASLGSSRFYKSIGGIDVHGLEAEITANSEREITLGRLPRIIDTSLRLNYSYQDAKDSESGEPAPGLARHKGNAGVIFRLLAAEADNQGSPSIFRSFSDEFSFYLNLFLCGERLRSDDDSREALPGYGILDMTLRANNVFHKKLDLAFSIKNALDKSYDDPSPEFLENNEETFWGLSGDLPNPGRSLWLEFRYTF